MTPLLPIYFEEGLSRMLFRQAFLFHHFFHQSEDIAVDIHRQCTAGSEHKVVVSAFFQRRQQAGGAGVL